MKTSYKSKKEIRSWAMRNAKGYSYSAAPIVIEDGKSPPRWAGSSYHFENKSGDYIRHPNAYRRVWGKPIYIASTRHIVVGKDWVKQLEIDIIQVRLSRHRNRLVHRELAEFVFNFD
jgi:hypothetical protein